MQISILKTALAAAVVIAAAGGTASANGFGGFGGGYGYNFGQLYSNLENRIPYFAAFPPVYYSYPVPRTYGYSPFAYPPYTATPELDLAASQPKMIINPHAKPASSPSGPSLPETVSAPVEGGPLVINNPYVLDGPRVLPASRAL